MPSSKLCGEFDVFVMASVTMTKVPVALAVNPSPLETDFSVSTLTTFAFIVLRKAVAPKFATDTVDPFNMQADWA